MRIILFSVAFIYTTTFQGQGGFVSRISTSGGFDQATRDCFAVPNNLYVGLGYESFDAAGKQSKLVTCVLNSTGELVTSHVYGDSLTYLNSDAIRTSFKDNNGIYYAGGMMPPGSTRIVGTLIKFGLDGSRKWQSFFSDPARTLLPYNCTRAFDGGFLITGYSGDSAVLYSDKLCLLIKTDATGHELWRKEIAKPVPNFTGIKTIIQDSATGNIFLFGYERRGSSTWHQPYDCRIMLDSLGNVLRREVFMKYPGQCNDAWVCTDKSIVVCGEVNDTIYKDKSAPFLYKFHPSTPDSIIWRLDLYREFQWANRFRSVTELPDGDLIVSCLYDTTKNGFSYNLMKYLKVDNLSGKVLWERIYDYGPGEGHNSQYCVSVNPTPDGGWISSIQSFTGAPDQFLFVKFDNSGCDNQAPDCNPVGVGEIHSAPYCRLFPNPSNGCTTLQVNENLTGMKSVKILDAMGRTILADTFFDDTYKLVTSAFPGGCYKVLLESNGFYFNATLIVD
jgi:hypothetical protein